jgi:hypothetical protein
MKYCLVNESAEVDFLEGDDLFFGYSDHVLDLTEIYHGSQAARRGNAGCGRQELRGDVVPR